MDKLIKDAPPKYEDLRQLALFQFAKLEIEPNTFIHLRRDSTINEVLQHFKDNVPGLWNHLEKRYPYLNPDTFDQSDCAIEEFPIVILNKTTEKQLLTIHNFQSYDNFTGAQIAFMFHGGNKGAGTIQVQWGMYYYFIIYFKEII